MSSVKSRKVSLFVIRSIVAIAGVLMIAFQNCSRVDTLQVSDLAGKVVMGNEFSRNNNSDEVNVQIEQEDGTTLTIDHLGNETVGSQVTGPADNSMGNSTTPNNNSSSGTASGPATSNQPVLETEDDNDSDLDVCVAEEQLHRRHNHGKNGVDHDNDDRDDEDHGEHNDDRNEERHGKNGDDDHEGRTPMLQNERSHHNTLASFQKVKCKKSKKDKKHDRPRCLDLINQSGATVIDIAKLDQVAVISSLRGKTIIYSSNPEITSSRSLIIDNAVGKTIVCGIGITRLDIKKGNLELREGSNIKACGEIKGNIYKDEESSIDGSESE